jgi:hypothetical protein
MDDPVPLVVSASVAVASPPLTYIPLAVLTAEPGSAAALVSGVGALAVFMPSSLRSATQSFGTADCAYP